eukprot:4052256-Amphidinium_carterae.1
MLEQGPQKVRRRRQTLEEKAQNTRRGVTLLEGMKLQASERMARWEQVPQKIREELYKFHIGMGHVAHSGMMRMLKRAGAHPDILRLVPLMPCATCQDSLHRRYPRAVRRPHGNYVFNQTLGLDVFYVHDSARQTFKCLNIVCLQTQFQVVAVLEPGTGPPRAALILEQFGIVWCSWAGYPVSVQADLGKEFLGMFRTVLNSFGVELKQTPLEAPWQQGLVEKLGGVWKEVFNQVCVDCQLQGLLDVRLASGMVSRARNEASRVGGYSPAEWVLGSHGPRLPGDLLNDEEEWKLEVHKAALDPQSAMARNLSIRESARIACMKLDNDSRIRRAILRNQRAVDPSLLVEGLPVYYHKQQVSGPEQTTNWHGLARIIGFEGESKQRVWLRRAGTTVLVSAQQIRHALPEEIECFD